ncbi:MAG: cold-shock protein [Candidatus Proteinoplasmatales archaeon SG8-5]|nr:MAG: cold-shock protein [Candidatus Proteinoplasmatales archaeon SG8-5]
MQGTVKWYNRIKAYGFIEVEGEKDIFVHKSALPENVVLYEGDSVEFEVEETDKGTQAVNVQKL